SPNAIRRQQSLARNVNAMKLLKTLCLIVITLASATILYLAWPRLARDFPVLKRLHAKFESLGEPNSATSSHRGNLVIVTNKPGHDLTSDQAQWLEIKRRRHQLLSDALVKP